MLNDAIQIFFSSDTELSEWEAINKEWRSDVYVHCDGLMFHLNVYTPTRLIQDFNEEVKYYGFYSVDANIILVTATDKKTIISSILKLYDERYFDNIKSIPSNKNELLVKMY